MLFLFLPCQIPTPSATRTAKIPKTIAIIFELSKLFFWAGRLEIEVGVAGWDDRSSDIEACNTVSA